jgi:hypothetical protein
MANWTHTRDLTDVFFDKLPLLCAELQCDKLHLLSVMMAESGVYASARNPNGGATGLIQFMPQTLKNLGWKGHPEEFAGMPADKQLSYVRLYLLPHAGKLGSIASLYCTVFLPADTALASDPEFQLVVLGGRRSWAYMPNKGFDADKNGAIEVREMEEAVNRQCRGPRWREILIRAGYAKVQVVPVDTADLASTFGLQTALTKLGFDPGPVDGIPGSRTRAALVAFQTSAGLQPDGIPGPKTFAALRQALKPSAAPALAKVTPEVSADKETDGA